MASSLEEQSEDFMTCGVCFESYNQITSPQIREHKPKLLPCSHTYCLACLKSIGRDPGNKITCPVCQSKLELPVASVTNLPDNRYVIHMIEVDNEEKAKQSRCSTCRGLVKPNLIIPLGKQVTDGQNQQQGSRDGAFTAKCFAVHHNESDVISSFHCKDLLGHKSTVHSVEFSDDGTLLASGGWDTIVRLWPISQEAVDDSQNPIIPIEMKKRHKKVASSLAIAPNNSRIFSGDWSEQSVFIHDVETKKLLHSVTCDSMEGVYCISLKPDSDGNVFATATFNGVFIFDTRHSTSVPVQQVNDEFVKSVMFSPANYSLIAVAGSDGTQILDIRIGVDRCLHSFSTMSTQSVKFDGKGIRLLCKSKDLLVVYNVPPEQQQQPTDVYNYVHLTASGYSTANKIIRSSCCFAGGEDELIVASSNDKQLYIWLVSSFDEPMNRKIKQPLLTLPGHRYSASEVRFCKATETLAFDDGQVIKLWKPNRR